MKIFNSISQNIRRYSFKPLPTLVLFIILTMIGAIRGLQHYYVVDAFEPIQFGLWWHVPFNIFLWWLWLLFVPIITWMIERLAPMKGHVWYWLIVCIVAPVVIVFIRQAIASFIISEVLHGYKDFYTLLHIRLFSNIWIWLDYGMYFAILFGVQLLIFYNKEKELERQVLEIERQLAQSQLQALESQLHPHFLFNTLNTLSTLILKKDKEQVLAMLRLLQKFLTTTLMEDAHKEIPLEEELQYISQYLQIEKVRFQNRLVVKEKIDPETADGAVPRFLLQPIIENSVTHGIAPKPNGGTISIQTERTDGWLTIMVEDNGAGVHQSNQTKSGIGLKITQERLARMYGSRYAFLCEIPSDGGF
nr:histidine kinase [Bacteroidota bacterium]